MMHNHIQSTMGSVQGMNATHPGMIYNSDAMSQMGSNMGGYMSSHAGMPGMSNGLFDGSLTSLLSTVIPVLIWLLAIAAIVFLAKGLWEAYKTRHTTEPLSAPNKALDILKTRYAQGEISSDEFESMKQVIA